MKKHGKLKRLLSLLVSVMLLLPSVAGATGSQSGAMEANGKFYLDYATLAEEQIAAEELAIEIASEGMVLLKNDGALPLTAKEKKVSLFGTASYNLVHSGSGSGAGTVGNNGVAFKTLEDSLLSSGLRLNQTLVNLYKSYAGSAPEMPVEELTNTIASTYKSYQDVAIITFSRVGGEDEDLSAHDVEGHADPNDHELMLMDNEKALIRHVKQHFSKVIVLLNTSNVMQIGELNEPKTADNLGVDAILWIGGVGNSGAMAVGKLLTGEVNPSGRTVDTWLVDLTQGPSWTNYATQSQNIDEDGNRMDAAIYNEEGADTGYRIAEYREGIYNGYRYYETAYADAPEGEKEAAYANVLYPFGYGLSYTGFDWELVDTDLTGAISDRAEEITIRVKVTNTGNVAGKDVVQLYSNPPYTVGGIEKAAANLVGFAKTDLLAPGESQVVTISVVAQELASFDWDDRNGNGFSGYELEAGDYVLNVNRDSHTVAAAVTRTVAETILCETDLVTGEAIQPVFVDDYTTVSDSLLDNQISRADGLTQPAPISKEDRIWDEGTIEFLDSQENYQPYQDSEDDPWYIASVPETWTQAATHAEDYSDVTTRLYTLAGKRFDEPTVTDGVAVAAEDENTRAWDEFMNQLTWNDLVDLVVTGRPPKMIDSLGLEINGYVNGPVQAGSGLLWPSAPVVASTFNTELAEEQGRLIANECYFLDTRAWAGPGANLHRNALLGRAFEYYSEDGYLAGVFASTVVRTVTEKGIICYVKHMMLNDQEQYRNTKGGVLTFADEQVIREQYAKPFEMLAKQGKTLGYMSSFNRLGYWNASADYAMQKVLVRGEWAFEGRTWTDAWVKSYAPINILVRAGDEQPLGDGRDFPVYTLTQGEWSADDNCVKVPANQAETAEGVNTLLSPTHYYWVRKAAQRVLFTTVNSIANKNGLNLETGHITFAQHIPATIGLKLDGLENITNLELVSGELPEGLQLDGTAITGVASTIGDYPVTIKGVAFNWVTFQADVVVHVVNPLQVASNAVELSNADANTIRVKAGEAIELDVYSNYLQYGKQYKLGGGTGGIMLPMEGFNGKGRMPAATIQIINLYQQFEDWNECADTVAHPLYRGNIGAIPRDEDSTAGDMPTADVLGGNYAQAYEYSFSCKKLPEGLQMEKIMQLVYGLSYGSYEVEKSAKITGTVTTPGTYEIELNLLVPAGGVTGGWIGKLWFTNVHLGQLSRTITLVVE
ncbi:MAG: glycoside hydrolase family 3 C-terminal domain-containing protein [Aristaeellaceae bacterium]